MTRLDPLPRQRARDSVYEALRTAILSRSFAPGERLNVHDLALQLGVSLTPVKDALTRLEAEALIDIRPRSGTYVTAVTPEDVAETFDLRCALECLAAERALERIGPADIDRLRSLADAIAQGTDDETHASRNIEFHKLIIALAGSRRLTDMYESLDAHIQIARIHLGRGDWKTRLDSEHREHLAIVTGFVTRDRAALVEALRRHIRRAADSLVRDLRAVRDSEIGDPALPATSFPEPGLR